MKTGLGFGDVIGRLSVGSVYAAWRRCSPCADGCKAAPRFCRCCTKRPTACAIGRSLTPEESFAYRNYMRTGANSPELLRQTSSLRPCPLLRRRGKNTVKSAGSCQEIVKNAWVFVAARGWFRCLWRILVSSPKLRLQLQRSLGSVDIPHFQFMEIVITSGLQPAR